MVYNQSNYILDYALDVVAVKAMNPRSYPVNKNLSGHQVCLMFLAVDFVEKAIAMMKCLSLKNLIQHVGHTDVASTVDLRLVLIPFFVRECVF